MKQTRIPSAAPRSPWLRLSDTELKIFGPATIALLVLLLLALFLAQRNLTHVARVTRVFLPLLTRAAHPRVVNMSSLAGSVAAKEDSRHYCYSASKAALNMLTRAMAAELRPRGVTVVAVTPGWVKTEIGGPRAPLSVEESAASLAATIDRLTHHDAGQFLDRDGRQGVAAW